jgi:hypothetical protein
MFLEVETGFNRNGANFRQKKKARENGGRVI